MRPLRIKHYSCYYAKVNYTIWLTPAELPPLGAKVAEGLDHSPLTSRVMGSILSKECNALPNAVGFVRAPQISPARGGGSFTIG